MLDWLVGLASFWWLLVVRLTTIGRATRSPREGVVTLREELRGMAERLKAVEGAAES